MSQILKQKNKIPFLKTLPDFWLLAREAGESEESIRFKIAEDLLKLSGKSQRPAIIEFYASMYERQYQIFKGN